MPRPRRLLTDNRTLALAAVAVACLALVFLFFGWMKWDVPGRLAGAGFAYSILTVFFLATTDSVRRGEFRAKGGRVYTRRRSPVAFWAHVVFFYALTIIFAFLFAFGLIAGKWASQAEARNPGTDFAPTPLPSVERDDRMR